MARDLQQRPPETTTAQDMFKVDLNLLLFGGEQERGISEAKAAFNRLPNGMELAHRIVTAPSSAWWFRPSTAQRWSPRTPVEQHTRAEPDVYGTGNPGSWWSEPVFWNSAACGPTAVACDVVPGTGQVVREFWEDEHTSMADGEFHFTEPIDLRARNILHIAGPQDWIELVNRFPSVVPRPEPDDLYSTIVSPDWFRHGPTDELQPKWSNVAEHYDGVHVTVGGFLLTAYTWWPVNGGLHTMLAGWNPGETILFRPDNPTGATA
ncbi:hypothetical protein ACFXHA_41020 [Nocardia sp. NPDC059240]|uniref:hypothetical protein n=1 Tax=Nocardia sp. NPDC059240 TaxID=3346786 RepID=UPI0036922122